MIKNHLELWCQFRHRYQLHTRIIASTTFPRDSPTLTQFSLGSQWWLRGFLDSFVYDWMIYCEGNAKNWISKYNWLALSTLWTIVWRLMQLISFQKPPSILINLSFHFCQGPWFLLQFVLRCLRFSPSHFQSHPTTFVAPSYRLCMEYLFLHAPNSLSLDFGYWLNHTGWPKYCCRTTCCISRAGCVSTRRSMRLLWRHNWEKFKFEITYYSTLAAYRYCE